MFLQFPFHVLIKYLHEKANKSKTTKNVRSPVAPVAAASVASGSGTDSDGSYHVKFQPRSDDDSCNENGSTYLSADNRSDHEAFSQTVIAKLDSNRKFYYCPNKTVILVREITKSMEAYSRYNVDPDDKFILAHITHVKRPKPKDKLTFYKNRSIASTSTTQYDRSFDFVDLSDKSGSMGRVIYENKPSASLQLLCQREYCAVGADVLLVEPTWNGAIGADYVPIFHLKEPFSVVPLEYNLKHKRYATRLPPDIPISLDSTNQSQLKYFHYKHAQIHVAGVSFFKSCSGYLCDRTSQSAECFDLLKHADTGISMKCKLWFCPEDELDKKPIEDWYMEEDYASYRFLKLFLHGDEKYEELCQDLPTIRSFIKKRVIEINRRGGVNIQGWYRQGKKEANVEKVEGNALAAAIRGTEERIASTDIHPHVSKIVCNDEEIPEEKGWRYSSNFAIDYGFE